MNLNQCKILAIHDNYKAGPEVSQAIFTKKRIIHFSSGSKVGRQIITITVAIKLEPTGQTQDPLYLFLPVGVSRISTSLKVNQNEKLAERNLLQSFVPRLSAQD